MKTLFVKIVYAGNYPYMQDMDHYSKGGVSREIENLTIAMSWIWIVGGGMD
ncbi:hypothetical protein KB559_05660 [Paenibacillus sp. Marseille-P2973]|uniref:hypothetical protein n=1 Tax=Paenibacillus sp. Marseille-P2973 TaxID=1871032 RepID=UPI001B35E860|nr:hypothetical protein [Paenibacillus sp. Marseille-P2973]MBQ4898319.1 hypothetical protein [Paenibacillus sp. Marseille-P2973]